MSNARANLIELKVVAGLATDAEKAELAATPIFIGGGAGVSGGPAGGYLVVPRPPATQEEWEQKYSEVRIATFADDIPDENAKVTHTADGLLLCAPDDEPNPRPGMRRHTVRRM